MRLVVDRNRYDVRAVCPGCGGEVPADAWDPVDAGDGLELRRCHCRMCSAWFTQGVAHSFDEVVGTEYERDLVDGGVERGRLDGRFELGSPCPLCRDGTVDGEDRALGSASVEKYCLSCRTVFRETWREEVRSVTLDRAGIDLGWGFLCPHCGAGEEGVCESFEVVGRFVMPDRPNGAKSYDVTCRCKACGGRFRVSTVEDYSGTSVHADRDSCYAEAGFDTPLMEPAGRLGCSCPACESFVLVADPMEGVLGEYEGLLAWRARSIQCPGCFTEFEDLLVTRLVGVKALPG